MGQIFASKQAALGVVGTFIILLACTSFYVSHHLHSRAHDVEWHAPRNGALQTTIEEFTATLARVKAETATAREEARAWKLKAEGMHGAAPIPLQPTQGNQDAPTVKPTQDEGRSRAPITPMPEDRTACQKEVIQATKRAWDAYKFTCFGLDELMPMSKKGSSIWGGTAATIVDALDTLSMMGLDEEFKDASVCPCAALIATLGLFDGMH